MAVLWLRFLREIEDRTQEVSSDLLENEEIQEALALCEEGAFTPEELEIYDQYWDRISTEKGLNDQARAEGREEELVSIVLSAYQNRLSIEQIQAFSGLTKEAIHEILKQK
jgi:hypothetical protein